MPATETTTHERFFTVITVRPVELSSYLYDHTEIVNHVVHDGYDYLLLRTTADTEDRAEYLANYQAGRISSGLHGVSDVFATQDEAIAPLARFGVDLTPKTPRYIVQDVSVGAAGVTARPAVYDTEEQRTVKVYRRTERHLAEGTAARLNAALETPYELLAVSPTIHIVFEVDGWAEAYGIAKDKVWNDATEHLATIATEAVREAAERLGVGVKDVRLEGTRTSVEKYR